MEKLINHVKVVPFLIASLCWKYTFRRRSSRSRSRIAKMLRRRLHQNDASSCGSGSALRSPYICHFFACFRWNSSKPSLHFVSFETVKFFLNILRLEFVWNKQIKLDSYSDIYALWFILLTFPRMCEKHKQMSCFWFHTTCTVDSRIVDLCM
jgi:hypothetical protein